MATKSIPVGAAREAVAHSASIAPVIVPFHESEHPWVRQFDCRDLKPLIVCRGPVRLEAIEVFRAMGLWHIGILLSDKDSSTFDDVRAPELYLLPPQCVHRIEDYQAVGAKSEQIARILEIAKKGGYNAIFAGYGFMAEDSDFVAAVTAAGLGFIGPGAPVVAKAGQKDDAKTLARSVGVQTTPGVDDLAARALVRQLGGRQALCAALKAAGDSCPAVSERALAQRLLAITQSAGQTVLHFDQLVAQAIEDINALREVHPNRTLRFKAVGGGGGKGQRLLPPDILAGDLPQWLPEVFQNILNEVGSDSKRLQNILIELNVDESRHQEIQLVGNGQWCIALGGRDCSVQWQEQKLLELSITAQELSALIGQCSEEEAELKASLTAQATLLAAMERDAEIFGQALGLDSVSTFECLVSGSDYAFMELNARLQVEHRVTEQCFALVFSNPDDPAEFFQCQSLIEIMVLLACHGPRVPKPQRVVLNQAAAEVRINATDGALAPHVGGLIRHWSWPPRPVLWDEQGIAARVWHQGMPYRLAGAYDSNIALLIVRGQSRQDCLEQLLQALASMRLEGENLETNAGFHRGLLSWLMHQAVYPQVPTHIVALHLQAVAAVASGAARLEAEAAYETWVKRFLMHCSVEHRSAWENISTQLAGLATLPIKHLLNDPHLLYGWLALTERRVFDLSKLHLAPKCHGCAQDIWRAPPALWLRETLQFLGLYDKPAGLGLWAEDKALASEIEGFYAELRVFLAAHHIRGEAYLLLLETAPAGIDSELWQAIASAHVAYSLLFGFWQWVVAWLVKGAWPILALGCAGTLGKAGFSLDANALLAARRKLSPPPVASPGEILAPSGGLFYAQAAPGDPPFIEAGQRFVRGQTLCIIEVMKMFNPVKADFDGTVEQVLIEGTEGVVVQKGQALFVVKGDVSEQQASESSHRGQTTFVESVEAWF